MTTPLSYRHAFGVEYDSGSTDSSLDNVDEDEEERQLEEFEQLSEMAFVDWLLGEMNEHVGGDSRKRRKLSASATTPKPYRLVMDYTGTETCAICLDSCTSAPNVAMMECHPAHVFHQACVDHWLTREAATCPLCQRNFATP